MNLPIVTDIDAKEMQRIHDETMRLIGARVKKTNPFIEEFKRAHKDCTSCLDVHTGQIITAEEYAAGAGPLHLPGTKG